MNAIQTEGLSKRYGATLALDALDLSVAEGEVYGYLGPNGAGKTTTIRLLLGLHRASSGRAELFGLDAWSDAVAAHRRVAYVAGEPFLWPSLTAAETFAFMAQLRGGIDARYRDLLVSRFQLDAGKKVRALSKGNRQKVQLVAAFATRCDLPILDEPTSGLDPLMEMAFRETVHEAKQRGQTIFLSSHILSEVEALCDRVGILRDGRLVDEGALSDMRHLAAQTVEVTFEGAAPILPSLPGVASAQVVIARHEEAEQRLETLFAFPVSRRRWLVGRLLLAAGGTIVLALAAGTLAWAGAASQGADVAFVRMLEAGANCLPAAFLFLGVGVLAFAAIPHASSLVAYGVVVVSFVWELIGALVCAPTWTLDLSPFHHVGLVPAHAFRLTSAVVMLAVAVAAMRSRSSCSSDAISPARSRSRRSFPQRRSAYSGKRRARGTPMLTS